MKLLHLVVSLLLLGLAAPSSTAAQAYEFPPSGRFLLARSLGPQLLRQCSSDAPSDAVQFWQPALSDIRNLENALGPFLDQLVKSRATVPPRQHSYRRQYVGFVRNGERFIYGNFYPSRVVSDFWRAGDILDEKRTPVIVCDGRAAFWGIVFRPTTKTFEDLAFNGEA